MSSDEIFERVRAVMIATFRIPETVAIGPETTSADVTGWDSLSHALLIMHVEEAFGLDLPFDRVYGLQNVGELVGLLEELSAAAGTQAV